MAVERKKTTVYLDPDLLRATRALAATTGRHDYEVLEDALKAYLGGQSMRASRDALRDLLHRLEGRAEITDEESMALAYEELHAARAESRKA